MKTLKMMSTMVLAILGTVVMAYNSSKGNPATQKINKVPESIVEKTPVEVPTAQFRKGALIEVAFLSVKEGKEKQLNEDYFAKVMPVAMEYGMKPLMTIAVKNAYSTDIKPQMVGFFEWPSVEKKEAFEKDERFLKLKPIRTDALSFLRLGFFEVKNDMNVKLDGALFYEIYGMDLIKEKVALMGQYFKKAGPICVNTYGVDFALSMTPVPIEGFGKDILYSAQSFGIAIWPNEEANTNYFTSKEYAEIKHFKEESAKRIDAWQGAVMLQ